jgi:hypothetical protein
VSATQDIFRTYRAPRQVYRRLLTGPAREDRALIYLMAACLLMFVAQWPLAARLAETDPAIPLDARIGAALFSWLFLTPLAAYLIAPVPHLAFRAITGRGNWYGARIALFWAMLAAAPLWLLNGLAAGFIGPGPAHNATGLLALGAWIMFWGAGLWVNSEPEPARP